MMLMGANATELLNVFGPLTGGRVNWALAIAGTLSKNFFFVIIYDLFLFSSTASYSLADKWQKELFLSFTQDCFRSSF